MKIQAQNLLSFDSCNNFASGKIAIIHPVHQQNPVHTFWFVVACVLLVPALLINLGLMTFIDDEAIRALVALEMKLSENYITPTLHGVFYYNKPPLFNWILLVFFELSGHFDEFTARIPTVLALLGYACTVFVIFRRYYGAFQAALVAFMLITCGRILFWDSMLALIDCTFSWVMFGLFMTIFHYFEKERWGVLFIGAYFLGAIGFMLKGLPALVFLALTLSGFFLYKGVFRRLLSWQHFAGMLVFFVVVGAYYAFYLRFNALETVFQTLFTESSKRTAVHYGWGKTILHFFSFPFEMIYHFFPWSLMILYILDKGVWEKIQTNRFTVFLAIVFFINIWVYWSSPEVYPRYLLMFVPLVFGVFLDLHFWHSARRTSHVRVIEGIFAGMVGLLVLVAFVPFFVERLQQISAWAVKSCFLGILTGLIFWKLSRNIQLWVLPMSIIALLLFRIGFNWFVLPDRNANDFGRLCRESSLSVGEQFQSAPLRVYKKTDMQPTNSFYLTVARGAIVPVDYSGRDTAALYIVDPLEYPNVALEKKSEIKVRHGVLTFDVGHLSK